MIGVNVGALLQARLTLVHVHTHSIRLPSSSRPLQSSPFLT